MNNIPIDQYPCTPPQLPKTNNNNSLFFLIPLAFFGGLIVGFYFKNKNLNYSMNHNKQKQ